MLTAYLTSPCEKRRAQFEQAWKELAPELDFKLVDDTARNVIMLLLTQYVNSV